METVVKELHLHKIIWGDVNIHNIFVDVNADAWVIDFGGNCNVQFVDEELKETYEGDIQGLRRIFEEYNCHDQVVMWQRVTRHPV